MTAIPFQGVRLRTVALPAEHGGWSFCLEPILLGLLISPSVAGAAIGLASLSLFLARHPFKLAVFDWRRGRSYPRTIASRWFAALYSLVAALSLALAYFLGGAVVFLPFSAALPLVAIQFFYDVTNDSRAIQAELAGATAAGSVAASIVLAGGWSSAAAFALWGFLIARAVPTVAYVRARVRLERSEEPVSPLPAIALHAAGIAAAAALAMLDLAPWLGVAAVALLFVRAALGLSPLRRPSRAVTIGITEVILGAAAMLLIASGYRASL